MNTEHVDIGLARYSDWAFTSSVVVLVAALLLLAVELAYSRGRRDERLREEQMVGAKVQFGAATAATSNASAAVGADSATPGVVADAPNRPLDERVAYLARSALRVVIGNGENDRELAAPVARVAPAWRPGAQHVGAYSDRLGRVIAVVVDSGENHFRTARAPVPVALGWTAESQQLVVLTEQLLRTFRAPRKARRGARFEAALARVLRGLRGGAVVAHM